MIYRTVGTQSNTFVRVLKVEFSHDFLAPALYLHPVPEVENIDFW
jgi:hypothetical protein